jgi:zinc-ribbon domain
MKFCASCGKQNEDQAAFCTSCGQKFYSDSLFPSAQQQTQPFTSGQPTQSTNLMFTTERIFGAHEHIPTDVCLKDASGNVLLVAKKESLLHENYNLVNAQEQPVGYISSKRHLTSLSFNVEGDTHDIQQTIKVSAERRRGHPPNCWVEDTTGNKQLSIVFTNGYFGFFAAKVADNTKIFEAYLNNDLGGIRAELEALSHRPYSIKLFDPGFSNIMLLSTFVALYSAG